MSAPDLLLSGAGVIERNGWIQGDYVDHVMDEAGAFLEDSACPVCPRSAIAIAAERNPMFAADWPFQCDSVDMGIHGAEAGAALATQAELAAYAEITAAESALARYIRDELRYDDGSDADSGLERFADAELIERWADDSDRTLPEVIGTMRAAGEAAKGGQP